METGDLQMRWGELIPGRSFSEQGQALARQLLLELVLVTRAVL